MCGPCKLQTTKGYAYWWTPRCILKALYFLCIFISSGCNPLWNFSASTIIISDLVYIWPIESAWYTKFFNTHFWASGKLDFWKATLLCCWSCGIFKQIIEVVLNNTFHVLHIKQPLILMEFWEELRIFYLFSLKLLFLSALFVVKFSFIKRIFITWNIT